LSRARRCLRYTFAVDTQLLRGVSVERHAPK
jgi:hypothetical protein